MNKEIKGISFGNIFIIIKNAISISYKRKSSSLK